ncbi:tail fiber domain-containing protein [Candidatus Zixiibacteriota bacterium]
MQQRTLLYLSVMLILLGAVSTAQADVPARMNYQGILLDSGGIPITTAVTVTFSIYDDQSTGTLLWAESQSITPDAQGHFNVTLGEGTLLPPNVALDDAVFSTIQAWLQIQVESDPPMSPRARIVTSGYSFRVATVDGASGGTITSSLTVGNGNTNTGMNSFVSGFLNEVSGNYSAVCGGQNNVASGMMSVVGGGGGNSSYTNLAEGDRTGILAGWGNTASGSSSFIGAGDGNAAIGSGSVIGGGSDNTAAGNASAIGGGINNSAAGLGAIGGGDNNTILGAHGSIAGGFGNYISSDYSCIGGGFRDTASGYTATVGGGSKNAARGAGSTIGGGQENDASGMFSTIPGGCYNSSTGECSFAAGRKAKALDRGTFVWADDVDFDFPSVKSREFAARCTNGARFVTAVDGSGNPTAGVQVAAGGGSWSSISDRNLKENISPVDTENILARLAEMPINTWNYKAQDESIRHIGPMAQDVYAAFGVGESNRLITTVDADGIALAAIQALNAKNEKLEKQVAELQELVKKLLAEQK